MDIQPIEPLFPKNELLEKSALPTEKPVEFLEEIQEEWLETQVLPNETFQEAIETDLAQVSELEPNKEDLQKESEPSQEEIALNEEKPFEKLDADFPPLVLSTGGFLHSEATGTPKNGDNTFLLGIPAEQIDDADWLEIEVIPLGASITAASFVGISTDKTTITVNFTQTGTDQATVRAQMVHSIIR